MKYQQLQIYRPTISKKITQNFGENRACITQAGKIFGVKSKCPEGSQSFYASMGMLGHSGIDIATFTGEDIYHAATFDGWWRPDADMSGGLGVDIVSREPLFFPYQIPAELLNTATPHTQDGVEGFLHHVKMRYWHLDKQLGHEGKQVTCGSVIGLAGNTGASSGPHLHFAPKWCLKDGRGIGNHNGFYGAFDPTPYYLHRVTAKDHAEMLRLNIVPLSEMERKDMAAQLSSAQAILLALQRIIHKL